MKEYIFYTMEGYTYAPDGHEIDNMQVLACVRGKDVDEAKTKLLADNPWIEEHGFDLDNIVHRQVI